MILLNIILWLILLSTAVVAFQDFNKPSQYSSRIRRRAGVPRSSKFGEPCTYNTDCLQNMYCPAGACLCLPGFVDVSVDCVPMISPGQHGCTVDRQCNGAWSSAKCLNGQCVCPDGLFTAETQDGVVCVEPGRCPLPEGYNGPKTSTLDALSSDTNGCQYLNYNVSDRFSCAANGKYQGDIYDCIPKTKPTVGAPGHCCPSKSLTCIQPKSTFGGTENRYWYNSITGLCEPFAWNSAGTIGNSNNFKAYEHCISYCTTACKRGAPQLASGKAVRCSTSDACSSSGQKQFSCSRTGVGQICCPTKEFTCSAVGGRSYLNNPPKTFDPGVFGSHSDSGTTRWYWNGVQCESFSYNGLAGNFNNFLTLEDCQIFCGRSLCQQGEPLKNGNGNFQHCAGNQGCPTSYECTRNICCPKKQTVCVQPKIIGGCNQPVQRYWFNSETRECETMIYSGCNGNDNNFASYLECQNFCRETTAQPKCIQGEADRDPHTGRYLGCSSTGVGYRNSQCRPNYECYYDGFLFSCCPTKAYTCSLQPLSGNLCVTATVRWHYDSVAKACKSFQFMGCNGNSNNFLTKQQCEQYCGAALCPYGGEPFQNARRICGGHNHTDSCPSFYQCVSQQTDDIGYCCPTRAKICSERPDKGQQCTDPSERFYFNPIARQCSTFTYLGCGGNGNKFSTLSQCNNFCTTTSCSDGEAAYLDPNSQLPSTCSINVANSCPYGFTCKYDELTERNICCGTVKTNLCPNGQHTFIESLTLLPMVCNPHARTSCPEKYSCKHNDEQGRHYCCSSDSTALCPSGKSIYIDATTKQSTSCYVSVINQCPTGYSCQAVANNGAQGFCCSINAICPNNDKYLIDSITGSPVTCSVSNQTCPYGYICHSIAPTHDNGHCCPSKVQKMGTTALRNFVVECPDGHTSFTSDKNETKLCDLNKRNECPLGYSCYFNTDFNQSLCCGLSAECPVGSVAYVNPRTGRAQNCSTGQMCSNGFSCQKTPFGNFLCCTKPTQVFHLCPQGMKSHINPNTGQETNCLKMNCPVGYECVYSKSSSQYVCCHQELPKYENCPPNSGSQYEPSLCQPDNPYCPGNQECIYIGHKSHYQCCPSLLSNDQTANNQTCDESDQKLLGEICCTDKQCIYMCGTFREYKVCLCPRYLLLDVTRKPYKCSPSCSAIRDGGVCRSNSSTFPTD